MTEELARKYAVLAGPVASSSTSTSTSREERSTPKRGSPTAPHAGEAEGGGSEALGLPPPPSSRQGRDYVVVFGNGPMGFSLTKQDDGRPIVTKVGFESDLAALGTVADAAPGVLSCRLLPRDKPSLAA
jgi:hypothetical protein